MIKRELLMSSESDAEKFAIGLASELNGGDVIALVGDLGTGKTTLTKYIAKGLGVKEMITSPTFTIVSEYYSGRIPLFHFDVYRLTSSEDVFETGIEEYFFANGVCVIEWADMVIDILPKDTKFIFLEYGQKNEERIYKCTF